MVLETLEDLGFCAKGEGGPFVSDGKLRLGGALPTNPDGGGLSACHPGHARACSCWSRPPASCAASTRPPASPERQVADAELACVSGTGGWFCANGTMILGSN